MAKKFEGWVSEDGTAFKTYRQALRHDWRERLSDLKRATYQNYEEIMNEILARIMELEMKEVKHD